MALVGGGTWLGYRMLREPDFSVITVAAADGVRAQQKMLEVVRRATGRSGPRGEPVVLSERELNAFLARHLAEAAEVPFTDLALRLPRDGIADFRGRLPLRHLVTEPPLSALAGSLPAAWLEHSVWLRVSVHTRLEPGATPARRRYLRLDVAEFAIGRQRLPATLVRLLLNPSALRVLRWPVPDGIEAITIEAGRVVIRIAA